MARFWNGRRARRCLAERVAARSCSAAHRLRSRFGTGAAAAKLPLTGWRCCCCCARLVAAYIGHASWRRATAPGGLPMAPTCCGAAPPSRRRLRRAHRLNDRACRQALLFEPACGHLRRVEELLDDLLAAPALPGQFVDAAHAAGRRLRNSRPSGSPPRGRRSIRSGAMSAAPHARGAGDDLCVRWQAAPLPTRGGCSFARTGGVAGVELSIAPGSGRPRRGRRSVPAGRRGHRACAARRRAASFHAQADGAPPPGDPGTRSSCLDRELDRPQLHACAFPWCS